MNPPIVDFIGLLGEIGLKIFNSIESSIDKRTLSNANKIADIIRKIPNPEEFYKNNKR
jgi:hypothetical protein